MGGSCLRGFVGTGRGGLPLGHPSRPLHLGHSNPKAEVCEAPLGPEGVLGLRPRPSLPTTPKICAGEGLFIYFKSARCAPAYLEMTSQEPLWPHQSAPLSSLGTKTRLPKGRARGHDSAARCERRGDCGRTPRPPSLMSLVRCVPPASVLDRARVTRCRMPTSPSGAVAEGSPRFFTLDVNHMLPCGYVFDL